MNKFVYVCERVCVHCTEASRRVDKHKSVWVGLLFVLWISLIKKFQLRMAETRVSASIPLLSTNLYLPLISYSDNVLGFPCFISYTSELDACNNQVKP